MLLKSLNPTESTIFYLWPVLHKSELLTHHSLCKEFNILLTFISINVVLIGLFPERSLGYVLKKYPNLYFRCKINESTVIQCI